MKVSGLWQQPQTVPKSQSLTSTDKTCQRAQSHPLHLTGYGSYGYQYPPSFSSARLSLFRPEGLYAAIAHIRGGGEMGRKWYEDGKFLNKKNTFTDFIACAEHLIKEGWTTPQQLAISGGSAGGLLMGAAVNQRPDLFNVCDRPSPLCRCRHNNTRPRLAAYPSWNGTNGATLTNPSSMST